MNKVYIVLILGLVMLAGCSQKIVCTKPYILVGNACCLDTNSNGICDKDETQKAAAPEQIKETEQQALPVTSKEPQKEMNATIKELLTRAKTKVKSLSYIYFGPPNPATGIEFTYKSNILKVTYVTTHYDDRKKPYDTVYLNLTSKTAVGYCEKQGCENKDFEIILSYDDHYKIMPLEILDTITYAEQTGTERYDNRDALILSFEDNQNRKGTMSVDTFWGLPLRIEYSEPTSFKIEYQDITANSVMDSDIVH